MKTKLFAALLVTLMALPVLAADKLNVVYHLSDVDKVGFVIGNIKNHIAGVGGSENVHIVLVVHGPAMNAFNDIEATDKIRNGVSKVKEEGVELVMCGNTLKSFDVSLDELLPGLVEAPEGGVTKIAELQSQGYIYIRP